MQNAKSYICQMKFSGSILLVLLSINVFAQINILVKDETSQKFELGLDGFYQTNSPSSSFMVTDLDTSFHYLRIKLVENDKIEFSKKIQFRKKGTYSYVITQNYKGVYQLRYRGTGPGLTGSLKGQKYKNEKPWFEVVDSLTIVSNERATIIPAPRTDSIIAMPKVTEVIESKIVQVDSSKTIVTIKNQENKNKPSPNLLKKDSLQQKIKSQIEPKVIVPLKIPKVDSTIVFKIKNDSVPILVNSFESMLDELEKQEFEFNKLNRAKTYLITNPITVLEIQRVFKEFKYDNTRIQFLGFAIERLKDPENIKSLVDSFDYELTKAQFRKEYLK